MLTWLKYSYILLFAAILPIMAYAQVAEENDPQADTIHPAWVNFQPRFVQEACPFKPWEPYDDKVFRCGYVEVPENRTHPESRLIKLYVLQGKTSSPEPHGRALIELTGGPGGTSLGAWRIGIYDNGIYAPLREIADVVFFDQRGTGYSEGKLCRDIPMPYQYGVRPYPEGVAQFTKDISACFESAKTEGMDLDGYTNWQNALDVRDIRRALGYNKWTLYGISYGTELGQAVMQVDASGVEAAILDSIVPAGYETKNLKNMFASGFQSALRGMNEMCAARKSCAAKYDDLGARFIAAIKTYDETPLLLSGISKRKSANGELFIDGSLAASAIYQALYRRDIFGDLPALLHVLETRDEETLRVYVNVLGYSIDNRYGRAMSVTVNCRAGFRETPDGPAPPIESDAQMANWMTTSYFYEGCETYTRGDPDPSVKPLITDIPILLVSGTVDPITPPYFADEVKPGLSNHTYVEFANTGHGALRSNFKGCGEQIMTDFITAPGSEIDVSCAASIPPPEFLTNLKITKKPYQFALELQSGSYPKLAIIGGGLLVLVLLAFPLVWLVQTIFGLQKISTNGARWLAWGGSAFSLGGIAWSAKIFLSTAQNHQASLPVGVPNSFTLGGWMALVGVLVTLLSSAVGIRSLTNNRKPIGILILLIAAIIGAFATFLFLRNIGASPF